MSGMKLSEKIPLWLAILININGVVGGAFFMGVPSIAAAAGKFSPLLWLLGGAFFLPIIYVLTKLTKKYPFAGGLYVYAQRNFGNLVGRFSGLAYFAGMAAGNAAVLHYFTEKLWDFAWWAQAFSKTPGMVLSFDLLFLAIFCLVCLRGVEMLSSTQILITVFKAVPLALAALAIPLYSKLGTFQALEITNPNWLIDGMPMVIFAYLGIECCCAMAHVIENGEKNTGKAIYLSFFMIVGLYAALQYGVAASLGVQAFSLNAFERLVGLFSTSPAWNLIMTFLVSWGIAVAYLGSSYSMFYANSWNFYAMSYDMSANKERANFFTKFNEYGEPTGSVLLQGFLMLLSLLLFNAHTMIELADLGVAFSFVISMMAFLVLARRAETVVVQALGAIGLVASLVLAWYSVASLFYAVLGTAVYIGLLIIYTAYERVLNS